MTTKTKKADTIDPWYVGKYVVRTVHGQYLPASGTTLTKELNDACGYDTAREAEDEAGAWNAEHPADAQTLTVVEVKNVHGGLMHHSYVYVTDEVTTAELVQGELLPSDAGTAAPTTVSGTLALSSPGSALMTATALKAHAADLKKLAKGARDLSQHKEALTFEQNATLIEETLLTQLEPQAKLPFGYADVKKALGDRISGKLRAQLVTAINRDTPLIEGDKDGKERTAKIEQKIDDFEALVGNVSAIVTALVEPVIAQAAEKEMLAGRLARETTADTLALEAVEAVANA